MKQLKQVMFPDYLIELPVFTTVFSPEGEPDEEAVPVLMEGNILTDEELESEYGQLFLEKQLIVDTYNQNENKIEHTVVNGVIDAGEKDYYSPNLIYNSFCYKLTIHGLPGNKFMINNNPKNILQLSGTGIFNMDFGGFPITSLRIYESNNYYNYPMTIDIVYLTGEQED